MQPLPLFDFVVCEGLPAPASVGCWTFMTFLWNQNRRTVLVEPSIEGGKVPQANNSPILPAKIASDCGRNPATLRNNS
jgi:hypothetical protein